MHIVTLLLEIAKFQSFEYKLGMVGQNPTQGYFGQPRVPRAVAHSLSGAVLLVKHVEEQCTNLKLEKLHGTGFS